jgi:hypothetical protein
MPNGIRKHLTPGKIACFGVMLFIVGNELEPAVLRQTLEILAGLIAALGLMFE